MSLRIQCDNPDCRKTLLVKEEHAGKRVKCPGCGRAIPVPPAGAAIKPSPPLKPPSKTSPESPVSATARPASSPPAESPPESPTRTKPAPPKKSNAAKGLLIGCGAVAGLVVLCCGACGIFGYTLHQADMREFAAGDQLWDAGKKDEAIAKYKPLIMKGVAPFSEPERSRVFKRVIESEIEKGDLPAARRTAEKAVVAVGELQMDTETGKDIVAAEWIARDARNVPFQTEGDLTARDATVQRKIPNVEGNPMKAYRVRMRKGDVILVQMKSKKVDSFVIVERPDGEVLGSNDDDPTQGGNNLDSMLRVTAPEDGVYRVLATCFTGFIQRRDGQFELAVTKIP